MSENNNSEDCKQIQDSSLKLFATIKDDIFSADLKWSLFRGAMESYKYDSLLKPFPKNYINANGEKNIEDVRTVAAKLKSISDGMGQLNANTMSEDLLCLFQFALSEGVANKLRYVNKSESPKIFEKIGGGIKDCPLPSHIFEVISSPSASLSKFNRMVESFGSRWGFHGSRMENFVSILNYGLQGCMMKVGAFGPGVYLAGDLSISLQYSPHGLSWGGSTLGGLLSVVALCEMISCNGVRCHAGTGNGPDGDVPKKYFIVENSELVRVRYLFVYGKKNVRSLSKEHLRPALLPKCSMRFFFVVTSFLMVLACIFGAPYLNNFFRKSGT